MHAFRIACFLVPAALASGVVQAQSAGRDTLRARGDSSRTPGDSTRRLGGLLGQSSDLALHLTGRLESRAERTKDERCQAGNFNGSAFTCRSIFSPVFDFQFGLRSTGGVADRVQVNVDYDSQREFDGSNIISIAYQGREGELLRGIEVGNVSFDLPASRFITSGIPSGNFGLLASAKVAGMTLSAIAAQQKGNVIRDQVFFLGGRTRQVVERDIQDYEIEPRRFFFTVDPTVFGAAYPNIDILDADRMRVLAATLPDTLRPSRVFVYRVTLGGQPPNPNGPRFRLIEEPNAPPGQVYELLREQIDYYIDPSQLWLALVRPVAINNERLVVAWTLRINGRDTTIARLGGTPDLEFRPGEEQLAHLVWDPTVTPDHPVFRREIRSVYRLGGGDLRRESVSLRIVTGTSSEQEKPPGGAADTYLEAFGLARIFNDAEFDADNRLWPRPGDPNVQVATTGPPGATIIRDRFVVFPSLEPFARRGFAQSPITPNDTIYRTPNEFIYSPQHPPSVYRLRARYEVESGTDGGTISLSSVQLRPQSERLTMDGRVLIRGVDYEIDYDLGRISLLSPDTLSGRIRRVVVRYEENPLFAAIPTSILGLRSEWTTRHGSLGIIALSQTQRTTFTRPTLGLEPAATLVAGINAAYAWDTPGVSRLLSRWLPSVDSAVPSRLEVQAEFAVSRPRPKGEQQAFLESFEGEGGTGVSLLETQWYYGSQPSLGRVLGARFGASTFDTTRAATLAFQNRGIDVFGKPVTFPIDSIDPQITFAGAGLPTPETILWMSLYPLRIGGIRIPGSLEASDQAYRWRVGGTPSGRRWRSIRTVLGAAGAGIDLSRVEHVEFWTLVDTVPARRGRNPVLVLDFGDISENTVTFSPESLAVLGSDSTYTGKAVQSYDTLDTERDRFSRAFNVDVNDVGLPGDVVPRLTVVAGALVSTARNHRVCGFGISNERVLGDATANCTVRNFRLDEEDVDQDGVLNLTEAGREQERIRRYVIDVGDRTRWGRVGRCGVRIRDVNESQAPGEPRCWVLVRVPFGTPDDSVNGGPLLRRVRAARLTMISGAAISDDAFTLTPMARFRLVGSPWRKRGDRPLRGIGGEQQATSGYVIASVIGTQDTDSSRGLVYEPPPGVTDLPEEERPIVGNARQQINERSLRLLAGDLARYDRAEAFFRFPEGDRNMMTYRELRVWARGRGRGWGPSGDLQFFVKLGRDANNFYLYRTVAFAGIERTAWEPEVRVRFERFYALRARLQNAYLAGSREGLGCSPVDSALVARSAPPPSGDANRYVACEDGYIVYTGDPATTPPNLAAVQEMAVGMVRIDSLSGVDPPGPGDTLEVWVNDIRLADVEQKAGYAGQVGVAMSLGDAASFRVLAARRDPNFRQLAENPTFVTSDELELSGTFRLDKLLPTRLGVALPLTVTHSARGVQPEFVTQSDLRASAIEGLRTPRVNVTSYSLGARLLAPITDRWYGPVVNHLSVNGTLTTAGSRNEFHSADTRDFDVGLDYFFAPVSAGLPTGALGRFSPTSLRLTTALSRDKDRRAAFLKPASAADDSARLVAADENVWRTATALELRPHPLVTAQWNVALAQDMRDYEGTTPNGVAATLARSTFAGLDVGLERERAVQASVTVAAPAGGWFRPRVNLSTGYTMLLDPNNRSLVIQDVADSTIRLARRLGSSQSITAAAAVDFVRAIVGGDTVSRTARILGILRPIDVSLSYSGLSAFDAAPHSPGLSYQLAFTDFASLRRLRGDPATSAGASTQLVLAHTVTLPLGISVTNRMQRGETRNWFRRQLDRQSLVEGEQRLYPDLSVRLTGVPPGLGRVFSAVGATARLVHSYQESLTPSDLSGGLDELRSTRVRSYPISVNVTSALGGVTLTASTDRRERLDSLPGTSLRALQRETTVDLTRPFALPASWGARSPLRTRIAFQESGTQSFVSNLAAVEQRSRLTDNGRRSLSLNADTDVAENMTLSLQGSRVVTFDRNFDRRFVQTVISAVLQLQFFGGRF